MGKELDGNTITPDMLKEFEVGNYIGINLIFIDKKTSKRYTMAATLEVIE